MIAPVGNVTGLAPPACAAVANNVVRASGATKLRPAPLPSKPSARRRLMPIEREFAIDASGDQRHLTVRRVQADYGAFDLCVVRTFRSAVSGEPKARTTSSL